MILSRTLLNPWLIVFLAGALFPLGFAPINWWWMPLISTALFAWTLQSRLTEPTKKHFWLGYVYGLGQFGVGVSWVYSAINTFGNAPPALAVLLTFGFVAILAFFPALFAEIVRQIVKRLAIKPSSILYSFIFAICWLGVDLLRGSGFVSFPWLYIGYSQTGQMFQGIASLIGVHGLSLMLILLSVSCAQFVRAYLRAGNLASNRKPYKQTLYMFGLLFLCTLLSVAGMVSSSLQPITQSQSMTLALIQPNTDQHKKWNPAHYESIINGLQKQTETYWGADLIIWPEAAIPRMDVSARGLLQQLENKAHDNSSYLLTGLPIIGKRAEKGERTPYYAGVKLLGDEKAQNYKKQQLVPFGEYLPFESLLRGMIDFFNLPMSSFTAGTSDQEILRTDKASIIPAICYEIAFSGLIQNGRASISQDEFQMIVTISNDTWFGTSLGPLQHLQMAQMRAIENGVPVVRATNNGVTAIINSYGQIIDSLEQFTTAELAGLYSFQNHSTLFSRYGYLLLGILVLIGLISAFITRRR